MEITRELISPETAVKMLENNFLKNRPLRKSLVSIYARDMKNGNWNSNVPNILSFTEDGILIDGQHRLCAVVESGKSIFFDIAKGVYESDYSFFDIGAKKSAYDFIDGTYSKKITAAARKINCLENGSAPIQSSLQCFIANDKKTKIQASTNEIVSYARENYDYLHRISKLADRVTDCCKGSSATIAAAIWFSEKVLLIEEFESFINCLTSRTFDVSSCSYEYKTTVLKEYLKGKNPSMHWQFLCFIYFLEGFCDLEERANFNKQKNYGKKIDEKLKEYRKSIHNKKED